MFTVEGGPYFCYDEEFFALYKTFRNCSTDAFSAFLKLDLDCYLAHLFVAVILCAVEETIASLDGADNLIRSGVVVHFPPEISFMSDNSRGIQSKANLRN